jgi:O-acetyl-ADP-ribose deacetylase (regulator of RNase III)
MITYKTGDIFKSNAQVITNTVNCVGVMSKGLALAFKEKFPAMFDDYKKKCNRGEVKPGRPYLWENSNTQILNFPTKRHWRQNSLLSDVEEGLVFLADNYAEMGISSIALPPLGCGLGGLNWVDVKNLINKHLGPIVDLDVYVYEPNESEIPSDHFEQVQTSIRSNDEGVAAQ